MEVWYKQNTGIKNPQDRNLDYFVINLIGANYSTSSCGAEILFYEFLEDAQGGKIARHLAQKISNVRTRHPIKN